MNLEEMRDGSLSGEAAKIMVLDAADEIEQLRDRINVAIDALSQVVYDGANIDLDDILFDLEGGTVNIELCDNQE